MIGVAPAGAKVVGVGDPVHATVQRAAAGAAATETGSAGVGDPALGPKRGRKKGPDPVTGLEVRPEKKGNGKGGPGREVRPEKKGRKGRKRGQGPGTAKGLEGPGPEMVQVSRERVEQVGMIGPGSKSRMNPRTTRVGMGGMQTGMVTTHRMTMTMEDTMLMLRLSMMTAKIVSHSLTVARTMSIEIQVLFTVE